MKKTLTVIFVAACMLLCALPSVGMAFARSDEPIGNERETPFPSVKTEKGAINTDFFNQFNDYFNHHFAFRPQAVTLDAQIQRAAFGTSNLDTVTVGTDGWLYYASTLNDFLGRDQLSDREIHNLVRNLELTQEYAQANGADFLFTVAPNKNTLYPEGMPYYYRKAESGRHNRDLLHAALENSELHYCDLFTLLGGEDEVLYLKKDSHWNNKGALMAYNAMQDALGRDHNDYHDAAVTRAKDFYGDLQRMLLPAAQEHEYNYNYALPGNYSYVTPTKSVEEAMIQTQNTAAQGSLYMYRDSFGNALLPFFADDYGSAYFTKAFPVNVGLDFLVHKPDTVIFEIAERNMGWFVENPPVIPAPEREAVSVQKAQGDAAVSAEVSEVNMMYIKLSGTLDSALCEDDTIILLRVKDGGVTKTYEAFGTSDEEGRCGFVAYIPKTASTSLDVSIITATDEVYSERYSASVEINQINPEGES